MGILSGHRKVQNTRALADPSLMDDADIDAEFAQLAAEMDRSARRWSCTRPGCNGRPHRGWVHRHARASQRKPTGVWTTWLMLTGRGWGKAFQLDTPVPTPAGWTRNGDLQIGDQIIGEDGHPCTVLDIFDGYAEVTYRLTFSDGTTMDVCDEHQWVTWTHADRSAFLRSQHEPEVSEFPTNWPQWRASRLPSYYLGREIVEQALELAGRGMSARAIAKKVGASRQALAPHLKAGHYIERTAKKTDAALGPRIRTTQEIVDTLTYGKRGDLNHSIPLAAPLDLPDADLPIDPYVLGYWLGDGSSAGGSFACDPIDHDALFRELDRVGYAPRLTSNRIVIGTRGLYRDLRLAGLLLNKHVPAAYLRGSIVQREALLAGLMDSDGYGERSKVEFCTTAPALRDAVLELARSLGQKPRVYAERATLNGVDCGPKWRVVWRPTRQPFQLRRKAEKVAPGEGQSLRNHHRMIVSAERIEPQPMRCLSVDSPNRMFLAGEGMIPTHNTRTAAEAVREWVNEAAAEGKALNIAVIGKKETLVREVCFQHRRSGLLAVFPEDEIEKYDKSIGAVMLTLKNGSTIRGFGANEPDNFRGYEFDKVWGDEYAAWNRHVAQESLDTIWFCLRESKNPQVILSTTPKPLPHIKKLIREHEEEVAEIAEQVAAGAPEREPIIRITRGKMSDNRDNLSDVAGQVLDRAFGNTRMGEQELDGILLEDVEGALWSSSLFEEDGFRIPRREVIDLERIVIGVDPAVTSGETADENGICVAGRSFPHGTKHDDPRPRGFVLHSEAKRSTPRQTMMRVAELYHAYKADCVILEANNGGEYLSTVLEMVDPTVNWRIISATRDKRARAAPVAALYEQGRIHHAGPAKDYDKLETAMTTYVGEAESREKSPDILDAAVWALTDLFLDLPKAARHYRPRDKRLKGRR